MGRPKFDARVSLKAKGKTTRLNLYRHIDGKIEVWRDGKRRGILTPTEFGRRMARWVRSINLF